MMQLTWLETSILSHSLIRSTCEVKIKEDRMVNLTAHPFGPQPKVPIHRRCSRYKGMSTFETDKHLQQALM